MVTVFQDKDPMGPWPLPDTGKAAFRPATGTRHGVKYRVVSAHGNGL